MLLELEFVHKYPGWHALYILVEKPMEIFEKYESNYMLNLSVSSNQEKIFEKNLTINDSSPLWGNDAYSHGVNIFTYSVPKELPKGKKITAVVKVIKGDKEFHEKYGKAMLVVRKMSDE